MKLVLLVLSVCLLVICWVLRLGMCIFLGTMFAVFEIMLISFVLFPEGAIQGDLAFSGLTFLGLVFLSAAIADHFYGGEAITESAFKALNS